MAAIEVRKHWLESSEFWAPLSKHFGVLEQSARWHAAAYHSAAGNWRFWQYGLGVSSAVAGGVAAGAGFADKSLAAGIIATVSAALAGLNSTLNPGVQLRGRRGVALRLDSLARRISTTREVELAELARAASEHQASTVQAHQRALDLLAGFEQELGQIVQTDEAAEAGG